MVSEREYRFSNKSTFEAISNLILVQQEKIFSKGVSKYSTKSAFNLFNLFSSHFNLCNDKKHSSGACFGILSGANKAIAFDVIWKELETRVSTGLPGKSGHY